MLDCNSDYENENPHLAACLQRMKLILAIYKTPWGARTSVLVVTARLRSYEPTHRPYHVVSYAALSFAESQHALSPSAPVALLWCAAAIGGM